MRLHPVRAQELDFLSDDPGHRHGGGGVLAEHQAHLDVFAPRPQAENGIGHGDRVTEGIERDMRPAAGGFPDRPGHVGLPAVDHRDRAELPGQGELGRVEVHADDVRPRGRGDHDCGEPDAATAVNRDPLAGADPALVDDRAEGRREAAAEAGRGGERHAFGQGYEIEVGLMDGDVFGEGAPMGEARLLLVQADLLMPGVALGAAAAAADERHGDLVARLPSGHVLAHGLDHAGQFVPRNMGERDVAVVAHPSMPVAAADAGGRDPQDDTMRRGARVRDRDQLRFFPEFLEQDGFHGGASSLGA